MGSFFPCILLLPFTLLLKRNRLRCQALGSRRVFVCVLDSIPLMKLIRRNALSVSERSMSVWIYVALNFPNVIVWWGPSNSHLNIHNFSHFSFVWARNVWTNVYISNIIALFAFRFRSSNSPSLIIIFRSFSLAALSPVTSQHPIIALSWEHAAKGTHRKCACLTKMDFLFR